MSRFWFRAALKWSALAVGAMVLGSMAGYALGWRIVLDGGGGAHLRRPLSAETQARIIELHRATQRAQAGDAVRDDATSGSASAAAATAAAVPAAADGGTVAEAADTDAAPETAPESAPLEPAGPKVVEAADPAPLPSDAWTDFRGPGRTGLYTERSIRLDWPASGLTPLWMQPVGAGYASFVVGNGRAYTIEQRAREEVVAAYDPVTGRELWTNRWAALFSESMGGDGPRATPTWSRGRVFALGATGEFRMLDDATGRVIWRKNILEENGASNLQWGMAAAPLVVGDTVIVQPGGPNGRSVVAYDIANGDRVWSALDDQAAYASPMLVTLAGVEQLLVVTGSRVVGLTPHGGDLLWEFPWRTQFDVNAAQPIVIGGNRVFYSSGYGTGAAVMELGRAGGRFTVREVWRNVRMKNQFTSSVLHDGHIYGLDEAILACLDAATGEVKWKGGRYGHGQLILADGHLIVLTEDGDLALVRATSARHEEITRFGVLEGKTWNHPSVADGILLVRNIQEMAALDLRR
jgi:outer membrane protein assembly factor BamB